MGTIHSYLQWWRTWRSLPIPSWIKAAKLYRNGDYKSAEELYQHGLKRHSRHPASISARLDLAYCLFKQRKLIESERELRLINSRYPEHREVYLRLARLQLWLGRGADAALTLRRGVQIYTDDPEMNALLLLCLSEQQSSRYLLQQVRSSVRNALERAPKHQMLKAAEARCACVLGNREEAMKAVKECALADPALFDSVLSYSELLIEDSKFEEALVQLRRALQVSPNHPRILSLMSSCYLADTSSFNPDFAVQLALSACQNTAWLSVRDLLNLAEAYRANGDRLAALTTARKAQSLGSEIRIEHSQVKSLEKLIEKISTELQA